MYIYIYTYILIHVYTYIYIYTHVYVCIRICICIDFTVATHMLYTTYPCMIVHLADAHVWFHLADTHVWFHLADAHWDCPCMIVHLADTHVWLFILLRGWSFVLVLAHWFGPQASSLVCVCRHDYLPWFLPYKIYHMSMFTCVYTHTYFINERMRLAWPFSWEFVSAYYRPSL